VFRVDRSHGPVWYAKYRLPDGRQVQKKIGPAWTDRGRPPAGSYTKRQADAWHLSGVGTALRIGSAGGRPLCAGCAVVGFCQGRAEGLAVGDRRAAPLTGSGRGASARSTGRHKANLEGHAGPSEPRRPGAGSPGRDGLGDTLQTLKGVAQELALLVLDSVTTSTWPCLTLCSHD